jgi:flagellin
MAAEIDRIANATDFNGVKLLDGSMASLHNGSGMKIHFGTGNNAAEDYYFVSAGDMRATQASGLRVGTSDLNDVWRSENLNAATPTTALTGTSGVFGVEYTTDGTNWNTYGYVNVTAGTDTLSTVMDQINQGAAATGTLTVGDGAAGTDIVGDTVTIGGAVFTFTNGGGTSFNDATMSGTVDVADFALPMARQMVTDLGNLINRNTNTIGVYANVIDTLNASATSVMHLTSTQLGASASPMVLASTSTSIVASNSNLTGGGGTQVHASLHYDQANENYELQLEGTGKGNNYQVRMSTSMGTVLDSNGALTGKGYLSADIFTNSNLGTYSRMSTDGDVTEFQNASGDTNWNGKDILTQSGAQLALSQLDNAIKTKDNARAALGALQNRLSNTITNLQIQAENLQSAESRISDVDVATEMTVFTRNNIMAQAGVAMLAQANSLPQMALQLLKG